MNKTIKRVPTRFGLDTGFEVKTIPFRATETTALENLKNRLLGQLLNEAIEPDHNALLRRAANDAAALAWTTCHPLLFFPTLLEEKAQAALVQLKHQKEVRKRSLNLVMQTV